ncbi:hypothetical protein GCM10010293_40870 [Streptomyces griseoflavus]|nr:hypothetical protein GCM10010293_40870 [Streptomyces griseoflavus]
MHTRRSTGLKTKPTPTPVVDRFAALYELQVSGSVDEAGALLGPRADNGTLRSLYRTH